jgi:CrcB protein
VTALTWIGLGAFGGVGALARFLLDGAVAGRLGRSFPFGTLVVNITGAFGLGVLAGATLDSDVHSLLGTGFVGAYTTFSTWALESHRLGEDGRLGLGALNFAVSLVLGLAAVWLGRELGSVL